jgi:hypothetical protein
LPALNRKNHTAQPQPRQGSPLTTTALLDAGRVEVRYIRRPLAQDPRAGNGVKLLQVANIV